MKSNPWILAVALFLLLAPCDAHPQVLVVLADHLTLADITRPNLPNLALMRSTGQAAMMSPGLAQGTDPVGNVYASLGAGDSVRIGSISQGLLGRALREAHVKTAVIGDADSDDTGRYRPTSLILPSPTEAFVDANDGTVSDALACGGKRIDPALLWKQTRFALNGSDLAVVHFGDFARIERENSAGYLMPRSYAAHRAQALAALDRYIGLAVLNHAPGSNLELYLVAPTPPLIGDGWDRLTLVLHISLGTASSPGVLWSATTQTSGLVAVRDIAPTILTALNVFKPIQMTGDAVYFCAERPRDALRDLSRLDRMTNLNQDAQNPLFWTLGFVAAAILFGGLGLYLANVLPADRNLRQASLYGLRLLAAWPLALLLAPLANPATLGVYYDWIVVLTIIIGLLPSPSVIYALTAVALAMDGVTGTHLASQSVLSAYALAGIRFYGIGNEYMGIMIGGALLLACLAPRGIWPAVVFAIVTFVLSFPAFGAKAGGAITATATFVIAWRNLRGLPIKFRHILLALLAGFGLVFLWALVDHLVPTRRTHIDTAVNALGHGRLGYIAGVVMRKIGLAANIFLRSGTLLGLLGIALIAGFARLFLRRNVAEYLGRHLDFAAIWNAGLWGSLVAVLFNDSGVVAAILLLTSLIVALLHGLYQECVSHPSTSAKSASGSPFATS